MSPTEITKKWIAEFVLLHTLCPFAKIPFEADNIMYIETEDSDLEPILLLLHTSLLELVGFSNAFLILPVMDFDRYLDVFYACEEYLEKTGFDTKYQLASFHPEYQFANYSKEDKRNKTNQSPLPMIHILRVQEMAAAIASYGDTSNVFKENEKKMRSLE